MESLSQTFDISAANSRRPNLFERGQGKAEVRIRKEKWEWKLDVSDNNSGISVLNQPRRLARWKFIGVIADELREIGGGTARDFFNVGCDGAPIIPFVDRMQFH